MSTNVPEVEEPRWCRPLPLEAICLSDEQQREVAAALVPGEDPERGWMRYLRIQALIALRHWLNQRQAAVVVGPEIEPEEPDRLLAIGGYATQLLCASTSADEVEVPLAAWRKTATAPQLALLALVDEENAVVEFPGIIDAAALIAEIQNHGGSEAETIELPTALFEGGLERLLRWVTFLEPEALPRVGLDGEARTAKADRGVLEELQEWLAELLQGATLVPLPVLGIRGGAPSEVRLITPVVQQAADGSLTSEAICSTPSIWSAVPLVEVELVTNGKVVWKEDARGKKPIDRPIPWPLEPLRPDQSIVIRLRPLGAPGGAYGNLILSASNEASMRESEEALILLKESDEQGINQARSSNYRRGLTEEINARLLLSHTICRED